MVFNLKNVLQKMYFKNVLKDGFIDPQISEANFVPPPPPVNGLSLESFLVAKKLFQIGSNLGKGEYLYMNLNEN